MRCGPVTIDGNSNEYSDRRTNLRHCLESGVWRRHGSLAFSAPCVHNVSCASWALLVSGVSGVCRAIIVFGAWTVSAVCPSWHDWESDLELNLSALVRELIVLATGSLQLCFSHVALRLGVANPTDRMCCLLSEILFCSLLVLSLVRSLRCQ